MSPAHYHWLQLPAGPRLAVATVKASECAAFSIHVPAGSRHEAHLPAGLAHFVEHMVFKGTARRTARELSLEIENGGGQINACTTEDQTVYEARGDADLLPVLADVLCDMVWRATFAEAEILLEREVIGEEIILYQESPADHIGDLISAALWCDHPLGRPVSGTLESLASIDRGMLLAFRDAHHFRNDVVIAAAGPFALDDVAAVVIPQLPRRFHPPVAFLPFDRRNPSPRHLADRRPSDQLQLALAWHTPGRLDPSRHALRLLSMLLGEAASSRLFLELREERGLCYQIGSDVTLMAETGALEIHAGLDPAAHREALACIHREIADLRQHGPRPGELERAKRLTLAHSKQAFESTAAHATWAGEGLLDFNHIPSPADWRAHILNVTANDVQTVANAVFQHPHATAEIGQ